MKRYDSSPHLPGDAGVVCDICGEAIPLGTEYVSIAAENDDGEVIGNLVAHAACAEALSEAELDALIGDAIADGATELEDVLPLERCCLCGAIIGDADYINFVEPVRPDDANSPLVAASFHIACYRDDPDGVQRALDEEITRQQFRSTDTDE